MADNDDPTDRFKRGVRRGRDPLNTGADGPAVTTSDSMWLADFCDACGHTFRQGDAVFVKYGPPLEVRHSSPTLPCASGARADAEPEDDARSHAFHQALDQANPPPEGTHTERLTPGHPLLVAVQPRLHCAFCSKTFRPYERAVLCPCSPDDPKCNLGVHRDPGKGNDCYDAWLGNGPLQRCPTTFQKLQ